MKPKAVNEREAYLELHPIKRLELVKGDIMLHKVFSFAGGDGSIPLDSDAVLIRGGQAALSHVKGGSANSEHAAIVVDHGVRVDAHFGRGGVTQTLIPKEPFVVYRCKDRTLAEAAAEIAIALAGEAQGKKIDHGGYAKLKAVMSVVRLKFKGHSAQKYLEKLADLVESEGHKTAPDMFCSELVAACYEVAGMQHDKKVFNVDPRGLSVKALEAMLEKKSDLFERKGRSETDPP